MFNKKSILFLGALICTSTAFAISWEEIECKYFEYLARAQYIEVENALATRTQELSNQEQELIKEITASFTTKQEKLSKSYSDTFKFNFKVACAIKKLSTTETDLIGHAIVGQELGLQLITELVPMVDIFMNTFIANKNKILPKSLLLTNLCYKIIKVTLIIAVKKEADILISTDKYKK